MAIDTLAPGYVPFMNFDLTTNMHEYLKMFDELLSYDFDVLITGHLTSLGTRQDVIDTKIIRWTFTKPSNESTTPPTKRKWRWTRLRNSERIINFSFSSGFSIQSSSKVIRR